MKRYLCIAALLCAGTSAHAADIKMAINANLPGVYGRIDLDGFPRPPTIFAQPLYIQRGPDRLSPPIYLHVPEEHARRWKLHCIEYKACDRPVYFVQDSWYHSTYEPRYRVMHPLPRLTTLPSDRGDMKKTDDRRPAPVDKGPERIPNAR